MEMSGGKRESSSVLDEFTRGLEDAVGNAHTHTTMPRKDVYTRSSNMKTQRDTGHGELHTRRQT